jgi:hypothetical protein
MVQQFDQHLQPLIAGKSFVKFPIGPLCLSKGRESLRRFPHQENIRERAIFPSNFPS